LFGRGLIDRSAYGLITGILSKSDGFSRSRNNLWSGYIILNGTVWLVVKLSKGKWTPENYDKRDRFVPTSPAQ
jgi:hypothetical protein